MTAAKSLRDLCPGSFLRAGYTCSACGHPVDVFCANDEVIAQRPEASDDWFACCTNPACEHWRGNSIGQSTFPDWLAPLGVDHVAHNAQRAAERLAADVQLAREVQGLEATGRQELADAIVHGMNTGQRAAYDALKRETP